MEEEDCKMKLRNKRVLKKLKDSKGNINWALLDYIMNECDFEMNLRRFSYDRKKGNGEEEK